MKIINNIMHINHSGANINIMCGGIDEEKQQTQNNFIFNHTAPINLNFYEEVKKKTTATEPRNVMQANNTSGEQDIVKPEKSLDFVEAMEVLNKTPKK
jgi:hypothetical protein